MPRNINKRLIPKKKPKREDSFKGHSYILGLYLLESLIFFFLCDIFSFPLFFAFIIALFYLGIHLLIYYLLIYPHIKEEIAKVRLIYFAHHFLKYYKREPLNIALEKVEPKAHNEDVEKIWAKIRLLYPFASLEIFYEAIKEDISYFDLKKVVDILYPLDKKKYTYVKDMIMLRIIMLIVLGLLLLFTYHHDFIISLFKEVVGIIFLVLILMINFLLPLLLKKSDKMNKIEEFYLYFCASSIFLSKEEAFEKATNLSSEQELLNKEEIFLSGTGEQINEAIKAYSFKEQELLIYVANSLKEKGQVDYIKINSVNKRNYIYIYPYILSMLIFLFYAYGVYYL